MAELADALDLGSSGETHGGSSPPVRTKLKAKGQRPEVKAIAESFISQGLPVGVDNSRPDIATSTGPERFGQAIQLIQQYQPWRLRHLRRDVREFRIVRFPSRGAFVPGDQGIITALTFLPRRDISAAPVAASILHEGMHARIEAQGLAATSRDSAREERVCRRVELSFGQSLPKALGADVVERAVWALGLSDQEVAPAIDWVEARRRKDAVDRGALTGQD